MQVNVLMIVMWHVCNYTSTNGLFNHVRACYYNCDQKYLLLFRTHNKTIL